MRLLVSNAAARGSGTSRAATPPPVAPPSPVTAAVRRRRAAAGSRAARPRGHRREQIRHRVDRHRVLAQLEVEVRAGRVAGRAHVAERRAARSRSGPRTPRCATCGRTRWRSRAGAGRPRGSRSRPSSSPRTRRLRRPRRRCACRSGTGKSMPVCVRPPSRGAPKPSPIRPGHGPKQAHGPADRRRAARHPPRCASVPKGARSSAVRPARRRSARTPAGSSCRAVSVIGPNTASIAPGG